MATLPAQGFRQATSGIVPRPPLSIDLKSRSLPASARRRHVLPGSPRLSMPEVPPGGRAISLAGGLHIVCRYSMGGAPMPAGERPPTANAATQTPGQGAARGSPTKELDAQILRTEREIRSIPASINVQRFEARSFVSAEDASRSTASQGTPADMMHELRAALLQEVVRTKVVDLFARIDTDKNGTVSREEFRGALPLLGLRGYARSDMDMLFDHVDADRNGYIEYQELWRMLRTGTDLTIYTNLQGADLEENTMRGTVSGRNSTISMRSGSITTLGTGFSLIPWLIGRLQ